MSAAPRPTRSQVLAGFLLFIVVIGVLTWRDRYSIERGNRLYRDGDAIAATLVYRSRAAESDSADAAAYNLGTALLATDPEEAARYLRIGTQSREATAVQRAYYNLGRHFLTLVDPALTPDSAIQIVSTSITNSSAALRLDPADQNARWNLALGQRMLDSLTFIMPETRNRETPGEDETRIDDTALTRSETGDGASGLEPEDPQPAQNIGRRTAASLGAREAWASLDPGPIAPGDAQRLTSNISDDPETLVRGILWSHRPDVEWWSDEPYPGGDW